MKRGQSHQRGAATDSMIQDVRRLLSEGRADRDGTLIPRGGGRCCVRTTRKCLPHALSTLKTLIAEVRRAGHQVGLENGLVKVAVEGEVVDLFVREEIARTDHVPLPDEKWPLRYDLQPTGHLRICVEAKFLSPRTLWDDSAGTPADQFPPKVLKGLSRAAGAVRAERLAHERREADRQEKRRLEEAVQAERAAERQHAEQLMVIVDAWNRSKQVRSFLAAVRESPHGHGPPQGWSGTLEEWLMWAERYADSLDPLIPVQDSG